MVEVKFRDVKVGGEFRLGRGGKPCLKTGITTFSQQHDVGTYSRGLDDTVFVEAPDRVGKDGFIIEDKENWRDGATITNLTSLDAITHLQWDWNKITADELIACEHDILTITNEREARMEKKMNKVYEGILVEVKDGDMIKTYHPNTLLAPSAGRARDLLIRYFNEAIKSLEDNGSDWDIIVREWK